MKIITQSGAITWVTWWNTLRLDPNTSRELHLELLDIEDDSVLERLIVAKYSTKKQGIALYRAINEALSSGLDFNIPEWESEYDSA